MELAPGTGEKMPVLARTFTALKCPLIAFDDFRSVVDAVERIVQSNPSKGDSER
ncbi:uncharacterized protein METZ01_LOCUS249970 [marine metagenome]|uniref:Uncharacterized protein n=1 Tax=marine metagenome TaxID=408172 RepID=A0A382IBX6_9ZZZZ